MSINYIFLYFFLKWQCHKIFDLNLFSQIDPIWAPDKQARMVLLIKNSFLRRYSNLKFEKFDSAQCNTVLWGVEIFWQASALKCQQKMLGKVAIVHMYFLTKLRFSIRASKGMQRQKCSQQTPRSGVNFNCWLRAVLACAQSDSAQCYTAQSPTPHSVTLRGVGLRVVLAAFGFSKHFRNFFEISSHRS